MSTELIELTADIVIAHASTTEMSSNDLLTEIRAVYATLGGLSKGEIEVSDQEPRSGVEKRRELSKPLQRKNQRSLRRRP